ncbi:MAG: M48 family metallopeptidase [Pyrinomonadaceae bacterium]|nr:M48 family metallopeptidase [Pyrinomonadaceae bacterium]
MNKLAPFNKFLVFIVLLVMPYSLIAQTVVKMPKNKQPISKDLELGRKYSQEAEKVFPVLNDNESTQYVQAIGRRLVSAIPSEYYHPEFNYQFKILNCSDINAFAIAGGYLYLCRGLIQNAKNEGEMVGVMAHEISHAALRHSTAQQGGALSQIGAIGLILGGAILGGEAGAQLGMVGAQAWMTKYGRAFEKQSDLVGARIMSIAGYDPRDLANMFKTIEGESKGNRPPQWLSTHPDPGNRYNYINAEAEKLRVSPNAIRDTKEFQRQKSRLFSMQPAAKSMEQLEKEAQGKGRSNSTGGKFSKNVPLPSQQTRQYNAGNILTASIPNNWKELPGEDSVMFAPEGAYGDYKGASAITHGVMIGVYKGSGNFQQDTQAFVNEMAKTNNFQQQGNYQNGRISGRNAVAVNLSGNSEITGGVEVVTIYTTQLSDGSLLYVITVSPQNEINNYSVAFRNLVGSIRINDR